MKIGSLFSGAGGLNLAVEEVFGGHTIWHVENDPAATKVLAHRWPTVPNYGDITQIDWEEVMSATPDHVGTERMYDLYCQGLSLEQVAQREGVSRQSIYTRFKRRGLSLRERPKAKPFVDYHGQRFSLKEHGYYRGTTGERDYLHRVVWTRERGPIPDGHDIHHIDYDKTNNTIDNLECIDKAEHARLHAEGGGANASQAIDLLTAGWP